jgi:hypothetical protein
VRLLDRDADLLDAVLRRARVVAERQDSAGSDHLDDVHAVLELRPHGVADLIHAVGDREVALRGEHVDVRLR